MGRPRLIPEDLYPEILRRYGNRESSDAIAAWVSEQIGRKVDGRTVRLMLERTRRERAPIAQAVVADRLGKTLNADLDAIDQLLKDARKYQEDAGKLKDLLEETERIAKADILGVVGPNGAIKPLSEMTEDVRRSVSSIKVFEEFEGVGENRIKIGENVEIKFWEKTKAIELAAKIRSGHMAMQAMEMQKKLLELRFRLSGAGNGGGGGDDGVIILGPEGE